MSKRALGSQGSTVNGEPWPLHAGKRVRVVHDLRMENVEGERVTVLMIGEREPELAIALSVAESRTLARELDKHADLLDQNGSRILIPGGRLDG